MNIDPLLQHIPERGRGAVLAIVCAAGLVAIAGCGGSEVVDAAPPASPNSAPSIERPPTTAGDIGYDVSWPQCDSISSLPTPGTFTIVGLNGDLPNKTNPCIKEEVAWGGQPTGKAAMPALSFYVTAANPAQENVASWPKTGNTPYGTCDGGDTSACAYQYGSDRARDDEARWGSAINGRLVFVDVEPDYSWEVPEQGFAYKPANNAATLEGMHDFFAAHGAQVGIYSDKAFWRHLVGDLSATSPLQRLDTWLRGAASLSQATAFCIDPNQRFTDGKVLAVQVPGAGGRIDQNVAC